MRNRVQDEGSDRSSLADFCGALSGRISGKTTGLVLTALIVYTAARNLSHAAYRAFWYDELCTWAICHQPSLATLWNALDRAADTNPPVFYVLVRMAHALIANEHIAYRLPSLLGFACTLFCIFSFVKRRSGGTNALICATLLLVTPLYEYYAAEARPYSLVVACVSIALVCYQRAPVVPWTIALGLSLALAMSLHYYAVLAFLPFLAAEAAFVYRTRQARLSVWLALLFGLIPLAVFWPLLTQMKRYYGANFWAQPSLAGAARSYNAFFRVEMGWGLAFAGLTSLVALYAMVYGASPDEGGKNLARTPGHEYVLVLGFIALPFLGFAGAKLAHGGMAERYLLAAIPGIVVGVSYILDQLKRNGVVMVATLIFLAVASQEISFWSSFRSRPETPASRRKDSLESLVHSAQREDLPVVVSDVREYVELTHYSPAPFAQRLVALVDVPNSIVYAGTDSVDKAALALRTCIPLQVYEFPLFASKHPVFLLYSSGAGRYNWWPGRLSHEGNTLRVVAVAGYGSLYLVELHQDLRQTHE